MSWLQILFVTWVLTLKTYTVMTITKSALIYQEFSYKPLLQKPNVKITLNSWI